MADREPVVEPEGRDAERRTRWPVVLLALLVALVASQFAPDAWPDDDARLVAHYLGSEAFDEAVRFDGEPIELAGAAGNVEVALSFVDGLTSGEPLRGGLRVARDGDAFQPDL